MEDSRLGCFTSYQRLWLYNGAPLVAFYDTLGIRRTYSRLKSPASSRGMEDSSESFENTHSYEEKGNDDIKLRRNKEKRCLLFSLVPKQC